MLNREGDLYYQTNNKYFVFQSHTILLVQPTKRPEGRTYADYESVNECMEGKLVVLLCIAFSFSDM